jgi:hypothetical protein
VYVSLTLNYHHYRGCKYKNFWKPRMCTNRRTLFPAFFFFSIGFRLFFQRLGGGGGLMRLPFHRFFGLPRLRTPCGRLFPPNKTYSVGWKILKNALLIIGPVVLITAYCEARSVLLFSAMAQMLCVMLYSHLGFMLLCFSLGYTFIMY